MVKEHDFKKCDQSGFCKRNRALADKASSLGPSWQSPYTVRYDTISFKDGQFQAIIDKKISDQGETVRLPLTVTFQKSGTARVTVDEERRQQKNIELRHNSQARKERYNEAGKWVIVGGLELDKGATVVAKDDVATTVKYGPEGKFEAVIKYSPFGIEFKRDGRTEIVFNERGLMNMEHWRPKIEKVEPEKKEGENATEGEQAQPPAEQKPSEDESTWWDETFGSNTDTKPRGPESVALDITFVGYEHVYGIPSHAGPLSLKQTRGGEGNYEEPYRLYNLDVFEYILDSPMTLYGAIPLMQAHRKDSTVAVFWLNAAETWIDIVKSKDTTNPMALGLSGKRSTLTHWISESGIMDVFVFLGPTPGDVTRSYGELTGYTAMPQEFAIGYHQCRWNYVSDDDVKDVDRKMDKFKIPYDVIWLDIEYTDGKKYFTWDYDKFKDPVSMGKQLDEHGRKLVLIIDPHIKNTDNYDVVAELKSKDLAVRNKEGSIFEGWCWPGSSHWIDAFNPEAVKWWASLFKYGAFKGTSKNTFIWNDMNEPSVFNGPETTMPKDNLHYDNWEHRDVHNLNGMTFHRATNLALMSRNKDEDKKPRRPFVLTRAFFAGSQRFGAMWTGDNQASWEHLGAAVPMILSQGIAGFPFSGADVGGFFGNPDRDLQARWYQAGAFYPFFRGHAHIDARRREPYLAGEPHTSIITAALRLRYSLLPSWYTAFHRAHVDGTPIVKPMWYTHPDEEAGFAVDDQLFVGSTGLLFKPVVTQGATSVDIYIPDDATYYDYFTYQVVASQKRAQKVTVSAPLERIPLLMRAGHIFPRRDKPRRSSALMRWDDYTLVVTLEPKAKGADLSAEGELYVDDGESFDFEKGVYIHRRFVFDGAKATLTSTDYEGRDTSAIAAIEKGSPWMKGMRDVLINKVVLVGVPASWTGKTQVDVRGPDGASRSVQIDVTPAADGRAAFAVVKKLRVRVGDDWTLSFA